MALIYTSRPISGESKRQAIKDLLNDAIPNRDFYILVLGAALLALSGIFLDSIPVLIASMVVAPLATPILALGLGIAVVDFRLAIKSLAILLISIFLVILLAIFASIFIRQFLGIEIPREIISFIPNYFFDILIAIISGAIAAYGLMRSKVGVAMMGIGIAVSLMPPLVGAGIEFAASNFVLAILASTVFVLNIFGILLGAIIVFKFLDFRKEYENIS